MTMYNVVNYDGVDAFVAKFILKEKDLKKELKKIEEEYNVTVLLAEPLYKVTLDNIYALKDCEDEKLRLAYERFTDFYIND